MLVAVSVVACNEQHEVGATSTHIGMTQPHSSPVASQLKVCPSGHATLKNVPIAYGLLTSDAKTQAAIARLDFWPGGCVFSPNSPTNRVVCTTCGLGYDNEPGSWSGSGPSLGHFKRPFSALMTSFPVPATNFLVAPPQFHQAFTSNRVVFEAVSYQTTEPFADVSERMDAWFGKQKLKPMRHSSTNRNAQTGPLRQTVRWKEMNVNADLNLSEDGKVSIVSVTHSRFGELSP